MAKTKGTFVVPRNFDHEGKRFATKVNESIAQLKGELGDPLDGAVTFRDLIDAGLAKRDIRIGSNGRIVGTNSDDITFGDENVLATPPAPTGVSADGAFQNIIIEWDVPTFFGTWLRVLITSLLLKMSSFLGMYLGQINEVGTMQKTWRDGLGHE